MADKPTATKMSDRQIRIMAWLLVATGLSPIDPPKDPKKFREVLGRRSLIVTVVCFGLAIMLLYFD